jgi:hypothetical protein
MSEQQPNADEIFTRIEIDPSDVEEDIGKFIAEADHKTLLNFIQTSDIPEALKRTLFLRDEEGIKDALFGIMAMGAALDRQQQERQNQEEV